MKPGAKCVGPSCAVEMGSRRIDQVNVVVADVAAAAAFLRQLGVEIGDPGAEWGAHHLAVASGEASFAVDLDSSAFARHWGGLPAGFTGVVVGVRVDSREEVDRLHAHATSLTATSLHAPYDAFWGSRFAVVQGPGPIAVGIMSMSETAHFSAPPELDKFT